MSEPICEICGRPIGLGEGCCAHGTPHVYEWEEECYRIAYERTLARADRYEAEFSACKALLIAAQQRAERAEAGRAEAERKVLTLEQTTKGACDLYQAAEQRASEARALALREAADEVLRDLLAPLHVIAARLRALAALPVEPARRQVTENANALGAPAARSPATPEEGT
jgi:hypothetical protein